MEPLVPSGSFCLFRPVPGGTKEGRKLLVWHEGLTDGETGGQYTLKVYHSEKQAAGDTDGEARRVVLRPLNSAFPPIELVGVDGSEVRANPDFVRVF
jgi:hypothetical protein